MQSETPVFYQLKIDVYFAIVEIFWVQGSNLLPTERRMLVFEADADFFLTSGCASDLTLLLVALLLKKHTNKWQERLVRHWPASP
mmetsp:Transcript_25619/g.56068  ORF Transcript_25619/g.56068 Transcript_25619/m.56068 type:complete len:85 (+) Transcript_25619:742-996(+)